MSYGNYNNARFAPIASGTLYLINVYSDDAHFRNHILKHSKGHQAPSNTEFWSPLEGEILCCDSASHRSHRSAHLRCYAYCDAELNNMKYILNTAGHVPVPRLEGFKERYHTYQDEEPYTSANDKTKERIDDAWLFAAEMEAMGDTRYVGIAHTNWELNSTQLRTEQGFVGRIGGLATIMNEGPDEIIPTEYVRAGIYTHFNTDGNGGIQASGNSNVARPRNRGTSIKKNTFVTRVYDPYKMIEMMGVAQFTQMDTFKYLHTASRLVMGMAIGRGRIGTCFDICLCKVIDAAAAINLHALSLTGGMSDDKTSDDGDVSIDTSYTYKDMGEGSDVREYTMLRGTEPEHAHKRRREATDPRASSYTSGGRHDAISTMSMV